MEVINSVDILKNKAPSFIVHVQKDTILKCMLDTVRLRVVSKLGVASVLSPTIYDESAYL